MVRRGFTLIEMTVVVAILSVMAAFIIPRFASLEAGQATRDLSSALVRLGADARLLAIDTGQEVQVVFDSQRNALVFNTIDPESLEETENRTITVPEGVELGAFTLDGALVDAGSWMLRFYPDGSGSDAGIEVTDGSYIYHVSIEGRDGTAVRVEGELQESESLEWQAGELEQRI